MAVLASKIIGEAADAMFDPNNVRFDQTTDWLVFLNAGEVEAVNIKPDIYTTNASVQLVAGVKQTISGDLIKIVRNMGADGLTAGNFIDTVDMDHFSRLNPDWPTHDADATVQVIMFDERNKDVFYNFPPQPTTGRGYVEQIKSAIPTPIDAVGSNINIPDEYEPALLDYILYRAHLVDAKHNPTSERKAASHWNNFVLKFGRKDLVEKITSPKPKSEIKK